MIRDEGEQAAFLRELLGIFAVEGVDTAFAYVFSTPYLPHRDEPRLDLDRAGSGVVKWFEDRLGESYPDMPWEPKAGFRALAQFCRA